MSELSHKERLKEAGRRLEAWNGKLKGFAAFHLQRSAALEELDSHTGSFFKLAFANKSDLNDLVDRAMAVDQLGLGLEEIARRVRKARAEINELGALVRAQDSGPFAASVEQRHSEWLAQLETLGLEIERTSELKAARRTLKDFEHVIPREKAALSLLAEAASLLGEMAHDVGRLGLEGDTKRWRDEFLNNGAPHQWTAQVRQELDAYRRKQAEQDRRQQNQPGRGELASLERESIPLATYWATVLDEFQYAAPPTADDSAPDDPLRVVAKLGERTRQAIKSRDLPADAATEIRSELDELLDALSTAAKRRSQSALQQLERRLEIYCQACETGPERDSHIASLQTTVKSLGDRPIRRPDDFETFAAELGGAKTEFEGLAANQRGRLALAASEAIQNVRAALHRLSRAVHSQKVEDSLRAMESSAPAELSGEPQAQESIRLLERCDQIEEDVAELERESEVAAQAFRARVGDADKLRLELEPLLAELDLPNSDDLRAVHEALQPLQTPLPGMTLDAYAQQLDGMEQSLEAVRLRAFELAKTRLEERRALCAAAAPALRAVQAAAPAAAVWPHSLDGQRPAQTLALLQTSAATESEFRAALGAAAEALRERTRESVEALQAFVAGVLAEGDSKRLWAEDLLADASDSLWHDGVDPAGQVLDAARWMEEYRTFTEDLRHNETRARESRERLRALQLEIQRDGRHRYCKDLFDRARRLLEGVPPEPTDWRQAATQLNEAEQALRLADREARRRIALALRETADKLRTAARRTSDSALRREIERKLAKLAECPPDQTPPNSLRKPLIYQARQL